MSTDPTTAVQDALGWPEHLRAVPKPAPRWIPQALRNEISKRDKGICQHCGKRATSADLSSRGVIRFYDEEGVVFHIDHLLPRADGGQHNAENLVLSCAPCNLSDRRIVAANDPEVQAILADFLPHIANDEASA